MLLVLPERGRRGRRRRGWKSVRGVCCSPLRRRRLPPRRSRRGMRLIEGRRVRRRSTSISIIIRASLRRGLTGWTTWSSKRNNSGLPSPPSTRCTGERRGGNHRPARSRVGKANTGIRGIIRIRMGITEERGDDLRHSRSRMHMGISIICRMGCRASSMRLRPCSVRGIWGTCLRGGRGERGSSGRVRRSWTSTDLWSLGGRGRIRKSPNGGESRVAFAGPFFLQQY